MSSFKDFLCVLGTEINFTVRFYIEYMQCHKFKVIMNYLKIKQNKVTYITRTASILEEYLCSYPSYRSMHRIRLSIEIGSSFEVGDKGKIKYQRYNPIGFWENTRQGKWAGFSKRPKGVWLRQKVRGKVVLFGLIYSWLGSMHLHDRHSPIKPNNLSPP